MEETPSEKHSRRKWAFSRKPGYCDLSLFLVPSVEEVSEGFMQLVENCGNGAAVIVYKVRLVWMVPTNNSTLRND